MTQPSPSLTEAARAAAAHLAAEFGPPAPGTPENDALITAAQASGLSSITQARAQAIGALNAAGSVITGLQASLNAVATATGDPNLAAAGNVMASLAGAAGTLTAALQGGTPLPYALADLSIVQFIPTGSARDLALGVTGALAYGETSSDPNFSAGSAILASVATFASDYASDLSVQLGPDGLPTAAAYAAKFALPLLGYVAGGMQPGAEKYLTGALAQNALDLVFVSGLAQRQVQP
jgi:hypothetical protein